MSKLILTVKADELEHLKNGGVLLVSELELEKMRTVDTVEIRAEK